MTRGRHRAHAGAFIGIDLGVGGLERKRLKRYDSNGLLHRQSGPLGRTRHRRISRRPADHQRHLSRHARPEQLAAPRCGSKQVRVDVVMTFILKELKRATVVAASGAIGYMVWKKLRPASTVPATTVPASPYPAPGARPSSMPRDPVGPMEPALIGGGPGRQTVGAAAEPDPAAVVADPAESDRVADEVEPDDEIDLSVPLATGDIERAD